MGAGGDSRVPAGDEFLRHAGACWRALAIRLRHGTVDAVADRLGIPEDQAQAMCERGEQLAERARRVVDGTEAAHAFQVLELARRLDELPTDRHDDRDPLTKLGEELW